MTASLEPKANISPETAELLVGNAFRGLTPQSASFFKDSGVPAASSPHITNEVTSPAARIRGAVRQALRPIAQIPVVEEVRLRVTRKRQQLREQLHASPDDDLINRSATAAHKGSLTEALRLLQDAARINPDNPRLTPHLDRLRFMVARSLDPTTPAEIREIDQATSAINRELDKNPLYSPGEFWKRFGVLHVELLKAYGIGNFKRTVSHCYQNWLMCSYDDPQVRRLLETWSDHKESLPFTNFVERPSHVGLHGVEDYLKGREYPLARDRERDVYGLAVGLLWEHVRRTDPGHLLDSMEESPVGNPLGIYRRGRLISSDLAHSVRERNLLLTQLGATGNELLTIGELGAGFGRLAEVFGKTTNYRYFIFDVAPALYVSEWYIRQLFPNEKIFGFRPFSSWSEVAAEVEGSRFAFFSANQIELIPNRYLDLFINMNSLQEMRSEQIRNFLHHIDRLTRDAFMSRQYLTWRNYLDHVTLEKDHYSLGPGWHKALDCLDDVHPSFFNQIWRRS